MENFQETLLKKTPCDECRTTKRRCSHERPCSRCIKKKIECKYNIVVSPVDEEYMKELEYIDQIECLETQICLMENELNVLKLTQDKTAFPSVRLEEIEAPTHYPSPVLTDSSDAPHVASWLAFEQDSECEEQEWERKNNKLIAESGEFKIYVTPDKHKENKKKSCILTVHKGKLSIHTSIASHTDLLNTLYDILYSVESEQHRKSSFTYSPSYFYETGGLSSLMWRGYGKQWIKGVAKPVPLKKEIEHLALTKHTFPSDMTTLQLIYAYVNCLHLTQFYIHVPYFMTHFIQPSCNILRSPAVMALCSAICLQACHHISAIIPSHSSTLYALYYFEQARELVCDRFDEVSLEIMVTYTFMAFYQLKLNKDQEALKYIEMAKRMYTSLEPVYHNNGHSQESVLFYRVNRCIRYVYNTAMIHSMVKQGGFNKYGDQRDFSDMVKGNDMTTVTLSDQDTAQEKDAILLVQLKTQLQQSFYSIMISKPSTEDLTSCIGEFSHQIEMALRHWYRNSLPRHFQLPVPLFEFNPSDYEFNLMLEYECSSKTISPKLLCVIYLYYTYLLMSRCYLPKYPNEFHPPPEEVQEYLKILEMERKANNPSSPARTSKRWEKFLYRKAHGKEYQLQVEGLDKDDLKYIENLFMSVKQEEWNFSLPLAHISVIAALQLVRLIHYLVTRGNACYMDYKWLVNACEILVRASRFKYNIPELGITLGRIRTSIALSVKMIRDYAVYEKVENMDDVLQHLEEEFEESVYI
ncbi:hypothetical protein K501DRAFT_329641 [Backusella circina FSU 941]|nr:hypothetical protein K501DRAFT_334450 [Backusella circina FSU 941]KAI8888772.1 hypothetical protein K501DRAFT_329641 [Backusella circina FSU 941]